MAGNSVWSNASCHSVSPVSTMVVPRARPTLLTRISKPPEPARGGVRTPARCPPAVARSAATRERRRRRRRRAGVRRRRSAAPARPRAQRQTRHPSAASARALARPRPRDEPVIRATLPVSSRFIGASYRQRRSVAEIGDRDSESLADRPAPTPRCSALRAGLSTIGHGGAVHRWRTADRAIRPPRTAAPRGRPWVGLSGRFLVKGHVSRRRRCHGGMRRGPC